MQLLLRSVFRARLVQRTGLTPLLHSLRCCSSSTSSGPPIIKSVPEENFKLIYINPFLKIARLSVRFKLYQTGFTVLILPPFWYGALMGSIHPKDALVMTFISFSAIALVVFFGEYFRRIIGMIYLDQNNFSSVKISHLSPLGSRINLILDRDEIIPLSESESNVSNTLWNVCFYNPQMRKMIISTNKGGILDKKQFEHIFGKSSEFFEKKP